ncbi:MULTISPECIES: alpha/beta hydrolase [Sphingomonas]|uniref:alpha/beta hydrolase n=1 Tax=Sphingomonas TaxID=13687 RepID=UPI000DEF19EA|nr:MULTISPECIES: alpha/beta hydrolase [Sphingomonas]
MRILLAAVLPIALAAAAAPPLIGGQWQAPRGLVQQPLWPGLPPNHADSPARPEHSETGTNPKRFAGRPVTGVYDVARPSLTIFPPRGPSRRSAVLVFPGGGFQQLAIDLEGTEACDWLTARGFTCALVKYRVPGSDHHYDPRCDCGLEPRHPTALQDAQRAIRLVRARAGSLGIDPHRIGVMGFSAGGYLVAETSTIVAPTYPPVDAADRLNSRPDFAIALYPGHLCRDGKSLVAKIRVTRATPPTFLLQAWDDPTDPICGSTQYARALAEANVPAEVHLFASGGHAFGFRPSGGAVDGWPALLAGWLDRLAVLRR